MSAQERQPAPLRPIGKNHPEVTRLSMIARERKAARERAIRRACDQTGSIWRVIDGGKADPQSAA